jgi:hypothetical protein
MAACRWERKLGGKVKAAPPRTLFHIEEPFLERYTKNDRQIVRNFLQNVTQEQE